MLSSIGHEGNVEDPHEAVVAIQQATFSQLQHCLGVSEKRGSQEDNRLPTSVCSYESATAAFRAARDVVQGSCGAGLNGGGDGGGGTGGTWSGSTWGTRA